MTGGRQRSPRRRVRQELPETIRRRMRLSWNEIRARARSSRGTGWTPDTRRARPRASATASSSPSATMPAPKRLPLLYRLDPFPALLSGRESIMARHYTEELGYASAGTMGITVDECDGFTVRRKPEDFPGHVVIDSSENSGSQVRTVGRLLAQRARQRDWRCLQPAKRTRS